MQLQVECGLPGSVQPCSLCQQPFEMKQGRVILCSDQGERYGEVCPGCISQGIHWLNHQFDRLVQRGSRPAFGDSVKQSHRVKPPQRNPAIDELMHASGDYPAHHSSDRLNEETVSASPA